MSGKAIQATLLSTIAILASLPLAAQEGESPLGRLKALARQAERRSESAADSAAAPALPAGVVRLRDSADREDSPSWTPDGGALYFQADDHGPARILRLELGGEAVDTVVSHPHFPATDPAISPDGAFLAYQTQRSDTKRCLWIRRLADGVEGKLSEDPTVREGDPAWSRAGGTLYFNRATPHSNLYRAMSCLRNGEGLKIVGQEQGSYYQPRVSPDGGRIAWIHRLDRESKLVLIDSGLHALSRDVLTPGYTLAAMDWLPDGRRMVVSYMDNSAPDRGFDLGILHLEDGRIEPLLDLGRYDSSPRVSPDGGRVAFSSNPDGVQRIYLFTLPAGGAED